MRDAAMAPEIDPTTFAGVAMRCRFSGTLMEHTPSRKVHSTDVRARGCPDFLTVGGVLGSLQAVRQEFIKASPMMAAEGQEKSKPRSAFSVTSDSAG